MAAEISPVTQENEEITLSDRELLEDLHRTVTRLEREMTVLLSAWAMGGLRGLRTAAKNQATPDRPVAGCPHKPACLNAALCLSAR